MQYTLSGINRSYTLWGIDSGKPWGARFSSTDRLWLKHRTRAGLRMADFPKSAL